MKGVTMLDCTPVRTRQMTMQQFASAFTRDDLARWTELSVARFLLLLDAARDVAVSFLPDDPEANDPYAADPADQHLAWPLGHVIAHTTASADEYATVAAEIARVVSPFMGGLAPNARGRRCRHWLIVANVCTRADACI